MPFHDFVDVRVFVDGFPLPEYPDPDGEEANEDQIVRYIEVTAGQRFAVRIRFCPGFQLKNASNIVHDVVLDGRKFGLYKPIERKGLPSANNTLNAEVPDVYDYITASFGQGRTNKVYFTFGALGISDSADTSSFDMKQVMNLGEIKFTFYRGGKVKWGNERPISGLDAVLEEIPEKLLKGRQLKNNVKNVYQLQVHLAVANIDHRFDTAEASTRTTARSWTCDPVGGQAGRESVFIFKYRSRKILQRLGCIPRSPSPPPDYALISERQEELIKLGKEKQRQANLEVLRLKQEIDELKRSRSTTVEPRGIKREREDDDDLEEVAPPPKKPFALIDLTENDD